ncbi:pyridoxine 5'-phosphate synthase [Spirosoma agri]|uniref:Pyridoxine 5'-phosphate synthase n=1 Tax=Spirosoma agri TaxID=1987381 RepID=A0A6M0IC48_9BACT|nr:pyridoxine 5'-phosphate synthase [Spirosoma agri]NEU65678.1 pyridoxine 5'-phosphate synthase [Spirosoma agri]
MTRLSVNINKIATIRNARGGNNPNLVQVALDCERFGAQGITVHPRPDERHIRYQDVLDLNEVVTTEFNIEGNPDERFIALVKRVKPAQVTLVPDAVDAITSNAGWDTIRYADHLRRLVETFKEDGIRVSIFVDADERMVEGAKAVGTDRIELYTEPYATQYPENPDAAVAPFVRAARKATELGLELNAGHDLSLENLRFFDEQIPELKEVSIGHALVCDALYFGLENTIQMYLRSLSQPGFM